MKRTFVVTVELDSPLPNGFNLRSEIELGILIRLRDRHDIVANCKVVAQTRLKGYNTQQIIIDEFCSGG
jgi:hypothetical protein